MPKPIHLLIPMSGQGTRYRKAGFQHPKPLIPVTGTPMIERLLSNFPAHWPSHFVLAENHRDSGLVPLLQGLRPSASIDLIPEHTEGPGKAILKGLEHIPDDEAVLVSYCDYAMVWDSAQFERFVRSTECDACLISYRGFHAHYLSPVPYAYSRLEGERVVEVREKGSFTSQRENEYASSGGYYFRTAKLLKKALTHQMSESLRLNGELYTSLTVQALLQTLLNAHVRVFEIPGFFQWGTPEDLIRFEYWEKTFNAWNRFPGAPGTTGQVLIPMAGKGSRFNGLTDLKKPMIPVNGRPMFQAALDSLPQAKGKNVLVALEEFSGTLKIAITPNTEVVVLKDTPPGQALSTQAGVAKLARGEDVIVSASDHGIVLSPSLWSAFQKKPDADAAIFTIQGFPGADRKPESYAYVIPAENDSSPTPLVKTVSVKRAVSDRPSKDHLLVGTFWFRTPEILEAGINELKKRDIRVNGELYLDSVFEVLKDMGHRVRMIPLEGYINWGDPDSLAEALYWTEMFTSRRVETRPRFPGFSHHNGQRT